MPEFLKSDAPSRWRVIASFAAVYLIWGSTYLAIRFAIQTIPPFFLGGIRFTFSGIVLYCWARLSGISRPTWFNWRAAIFVGGMLMFIGNGGVAWVEQLVPSSIVALLMGMIPLWTVLLEWIRRGGSRPEGAVLIGIILGFGGVALLIGPWNLAGNSHVNPLGVAILFLVTISWAVGSLYSHYAPLPNSPVLSTSMQMLAGGALLLSAGFVSGEWRDLHPDKISLSSALAVSYLIIFGSFVAFTAFTWLLRTVAPARAATYAYVNPVVAVFLGWAIGSEPLTMRTLISAFIIVTAVAIIITFQGKSQEQTVAPVATGVDNKDFSSV